METFKHLWGTSKGCTQAIFVIFLMGSLFAVSLSILGAFLALIIERDFWTGLVLGVFLGVVGVLYQEQIKKTLKNLLARLTKKANK
jgi:hypothetical protein